MSSVGKSWGWVQRPTKARLQLSTWCYLSNIHDGDDDDDGDDGDGCDDDDDGDDGDDGDGGASLFCIQLV